MATKSETLFTKHCKSRGISCHKIPTEDKEENQTPDYYFYIDNQKVIAEVTSLKKNDEEKKMLEEKGDKTIGHFPNTEKRLKRKIKIKAKQLKTKTKDKFPGIIVIHDDRSPFGYLFPDDFRFAMYGNDTVEIAVPNRPNLEPIIRAIKFGGGRRTNADTGTYISAIAHLKETKPRETKLDLFHNFFADNPLSHDLCWKFADRQFNIDDPHQGNQKKWKTVKKSS
ncbi:hypothetical protein [Halalkalibaculum sp. DA384]|uniref:hypothetical protein n=1 Tax=Halalkalibaculum sp. DA384 TaxID=3373606 RepID=UPI0037553789